MMRTYLFLMLAATVALSGCDLVGSNTEDEALAEYRALLSFAHSCEALTCTFTDAAARQATRLWTFADASGNQLGTSDANPATYTFPSAGSYVVSLVHSTTTAHARETSKTINVTQSGSDPPAASGVDFTSVSNGLEISFTNTSTGTTGQQWAFGDGATSREVAPVHVYQSAGTYEVTLTARDVATNQTVTATKSVTAEEDSTEPPPPPPSEVTAEFSYAVDGLTVSFTNLSSGAETYSWFFGDLTASVDPNPVHTYAAAGAYEVSLTATGSSTDIRTQTVEVSYDLPPSGDLPPGVDTSVPTAIDTGDNGEHTPGSYKGLPLRLTDNGEPAVTDNNGVIGVVCVGMSNASQECSHFIDSFLPTVSINSQVKFVDCAVGGQALESWNDSGDDGLLWEACLNTKLGNQAGITADDVRVIFHKAANQCTSNVPGDLCAKGEAEALPPYPDATSDYYNFIDNLTTFSHRVKDFFPNVQAVYTTSRSYGGYATQDVRGEPLSYEEGHALNAWLADNPMVDGVWYGWGPYIWAPDCVTGLTNGSGVCYVRDDYNGDGIHPSTGGKGKIAQMLHDRFSQHAWYK